MDEGDKGCRAIPKQRYIAALKFGGLNYKSCMSCRHTKTSIRKAVVWRMLIILSEVRMNNSDSEHRFESRHVLVLLECGNLLPL